MKLWHNFTNLYDVDDIIESAPMSVLDIAEALGDDDDEGNDDKGKESDKVGKGDDKGKEEKKDDVDEIEDENKEGDEDEPEVKLVEEDEPEVAGDDIEDVINPLSRKALLKDYPDIFKKYPQLEKGYYGNLKYRELFPTLDDAREASDKLEEFAKIETELKEGSSVSLFSGLKEKDPEAFASAVDAYLPNLQKVDPDAYYHVISNVIKVTIGRMSTMAKSKKDDDLMTAAKILNEWAFAQEEYEPPVRFAQEKPAEKTKLDKERDDYEAGKLGDQQKSVDEGVSKVITDTIDKYIDPNEKLTAFAKKAAVKEAVEQVNKLLKTDKTLAKVVDKMWKAAKAEKYSPDAVGKIRRATQERAKVILPHVIKKVRADALKGVERRKADDKDRKGPLPNTGKQSASRSSNGGRQSGGDTKKIPDNMSTLDFFNT